MKGINFAFMRAMISCKNSLSLSFIAMLLLSMIRKFDGLQSQFYRHKLDRQQFSKKPWMSVVETRLESGRMSSKGISVDTLTIAQHPELVKSHLTARRSDPRLFSDIASIGELRTERNSLIVESDKYKGIRKSLSAEIGKFMKEKKLDEAESLKQQVHDVSIKAEAADNQLAEVDQKINEYLSYLPNLLDDRVPDGSGDEDNVMMHSWGDELRKMGSSYLWHDELAAKLGGLNADAASRISGTRFSVLVGDIARLERSLVQYFLDFHTARGYVEVSVPYIVSRSTLQGTGQLPKFEEDLFKVNHKVSNEDAFLIPTAEVPVTSLYREQVLLSHQLPIKHVCYSPCFRAEAGSHGRDTRGLLRQHQFHKVELVKIISAETSDSEHEQMTCDAEDVLKSLELPFRRMLLCSGDIGFSARMCYDLEVWLPGQQSYREISSISNCHDFQSRRMQLRFKNAKDPKSGTSLAHTINGSGVAVGRALIAILENHQQPDGSIKLPEVLHRYMNTKILIPK